MILSDGTIRRLIEKKELIIRPYNRENIQSASIDLTLGKGFLVPDYHHTKYISLKDKAIYREDKSSEIVIPPHHFVLATTLEYLGLPDYMAGLVKGRSSIGRKGLFVQNADWVAPGFQGNITLELYNANESPFVLEAKDGICQIVFEFTDHPVEKPYKGRYFGQRGATGSKKEKNRT